MSPETSSPSSAESRSGLLQRGLLLERITIAWNVLEALVALGAGWIAGSIALVGFGLDSVIETVAGLALYRRLAAERVGTDPERTEQQERVALRVVGGTFLLLAAYVAYEAIVTLVRHRPSAESPIGIALACASLIVMPLLGALKHRVGLRLASRALVAEAKETFVCAYLSLTLLLGLALNAALGFWWADPVAALAMLPLLLHEGREALTGDDD